MTKNKSLHLIFFLFVCFTIFATLYLVSQTQILEKFAEESAVSISFKTDSQKPINKIWPYFSQGGEEQELMLKPASDQIKALQPQYIRIDHVFDFPKLDQRIEEITQTGAKPFFSLSYFPSNVSSDPIIFPPTLETWKKLVQETIQKYSGKNENNLTDVYYEVWNEPDLFGKMSPEQYLLLYETSLNAANTCQKCNSFKIGGPAITTLKKGWISRFLKLAEEKNLRLDFISWHSYQLDPEKTLLETETLKTIIKTTGYYDSSELIISEWGSVPEMSPLHDSYFDASHAILFIDKLKNSVGKIFAFELIDGPDKEGKKLWGRWGLIAKDLSLKPRYYSFIYLNKLLELEIPLSNITTNISAIGTTDGKENFSIILARPEGKSNTLPLKLVLENPLPGKYQIKKYFLDSFHQPLNPILEPLSVSSDLIINENLSQNSIILIEINRLSPALITSLGKSNNSGDLAAKVTNSLPPLIFQTGQKTINQAEFSFLFKSNWNDQEKQKHTFLESRNLVGDGISAWYENIDKPKIVFTINNYGKISEEISFPIESFDRTVWHKMTFHFDSSQKTMGMVIDDQQLLSQINSPIKLGNLIYIGGSQNKNESAEGFVDELLIHFNSELAYQKNFN